MTQNILGYVMARNEWPMLGLSIVHAFTSGIDHIIVVDHGSDDETASGLAFLKRAYEDRLTIVKLDIDEFIQEATSKIALRLFNAAAYDWVYIFDADEFILTSNRGEFRRYLREVPSEFAAVRYEVQQWIAPSDFNDLDIAEYPRLEMGGKSPT